MKIILTFILLLMFGGSATSSLPAKEYEVVATVTARITWYHPHEKGYIYGTRVAWQEVKKAQYGRTAAADPKKLPYGTKLYIPDLHGPLGDGMFRVEDTGSDVVKLKAIPKKLRGKIQYVIDIFVNSNKTMKQLERTMPRYMTVHIIKES